MTLRSVVAVRAVALAALALAAGAPPASADPRWWWDDVRLTDTPTDSVTPHLVSPGYVPGGAGMGNVFITWAEVDPAGGDTEIWATATFDAGCTFCPPTRITDNAVDDRAPRIAVLGLPEGFWSFAIAHESAGQVVVAWDSATVSFRVPFDQLCPQMALLGPGIVANDRYVRFGSALSPATQPDISATGPPSFGHFHAAWRQESPVAGAAIFYAHDLTARGGVGWTLDPARALRLTSPVNDPREPAVAADLATDPDPLTGNVTVDRTAVNVAWLEVAPTDETFLASLRSVDSGTTFSPTGARADAPAERLSVSIAPPGDQASRPSIDAAFSTFTTQQGAWVGVAWDETTAGGPDVRADARYLETPATPLPDWQAPDERVTTVENRFEGDTTLALVNAFGGATPAWLGFETTRYGASEIACRSGMLDRATPDTIDFARYPYGPVRALDPVVSADTQLSACAFDEATFGCVAARGGAGGEAVDAAFDASETATYAVWADSRDGQWEIYFKRTDRFSPSMAGAVLAAGCGPAGDAWIDVTFDQVTTCPQAFAGERMGRYLIHHGTDPGGPFDGARIVVPHDAAGGTRITRRIPGLLPGTTYQVIVVPEDQARNVTPSDFDPRADGAAPLFTELSITTPDPCVAAGPCLWRSDVTSLLPHLPARLDVYLVPPSAEDIALQGASYQCPFADGDRERDAGALTNRLPLVLYQVNRAVASLRLAKDGTTIRFRF